MKKIVICPIFNEFNFIEGLIENLVDIIEPDIVILNNGAYNYGPEGNTPPEFIKKYTLDGKRGLDYEKLESLIKDSQKKYINTEIILNPIEYHYKDASLNYIDGCSNFDELGITIDKGDLIFPYEADLLFHERDKNILQQSFSHLKNDEGFTTNWIDFIGNQYYLHCNDISRKICVKFGTMNFYKEVLGRFQRQQYRDILYSANITTYHLSWFRDKDSREMRYNQLNRAAEYWRLFEEGIQKIIAAGSTKVDGIKIREKAVGKSFTEALYYNGPWPKAMSKNICWHNEKN